MPDEKYGVLGYDHHLEEARRLTKNGWIVPGAAIAGSLIGADAEIHRLAAENQRLAGHLDRLREAFEDDA